MKTGIGTTEWRRGSGRKDVGTSPLPSFFRQLHNVPVETKQRRTQTGNELPPRPSLLSNRCQQRGSSFFFLTCLWLMWSCALAHICKHTRVLCVFCLLKKLFIQAKTSVNLCYCVAELPEVSTEALLSVRDILSCT